MKYKVLVTALTAIICAILSLTAIGDESITIPAETQLQVNELLSTNYSQDFGQKAINMIAYGSENPVFGDKSLLSVVSSTLNAIALAMMAFLAILGGGTYIFQTANKGVPGGQVVSSFWAPIRVSTATILLIPLASGYSSLQYGVTTIAEKGNAHGTYLMGTGLNHLYDFGAYRAPGIPDGSHILFALIESEVCKQYINSYTNKESISHSFTPMASQGSRLTTSIKYAYNENSSWYTFNDPRLDYCGAITFSMEEPKAFGLFSGFDTQTAAFSGPKLIAQGQLKLLQDSQKAAEAIAKRLLSDESSLRAMQASGEAAQNTYEQALANLRGEINEAAGELNNAIRSYNSASQKLIASTVNKLNDQKNEANGSAGWKEQTMAMGWPALGTIFWQINVNQSEINKLAASFDASVTEPNVDEQWLKDQRFVEISTRIRGLKKAYAVKDTTASVQTNQRLNQPDSIPSLSAIADAGAEGEGWLDGLKSRFYGFFAAGIKSALFKNSPDDLIINMQYFGSAMSALAEAGWWAKTITLNTLIASAEQADRISESAGNTLKDVPVAGFFAKVLSSVGSVAAKTTAHVGADVKSMANYIIVALIIVGFTLGVVLPTIPLAIWLMGVVSWLLFYIECMLISPIWMAAHGTAEKDGWGSEHTRQGYMLMIGLYLNPILRVAGFFAIFAALKPVSWLVSWFFDYVQGVVISGFTMLFLTLGAVLISAIFAYTIIVRMFSIPTELFEKGLRWVNGGQEVTGDSSSEKDARNNIGLFTSKSEGAAQQSGRSGGSPPIPTQSNSIPKPM